MLKKLLLLLMALSLLLSLAACSADTDAEDEEDDRSHSTRDDDEDDEDEKDEEEEDPDPTEAPPATAIPDDEPSDSDADALYFGGQDAPEVGTPAVALDPQEIYANLTYTPEMFYGDYRMPDRYDTAYDVAERLNTLHLTIDGEALMLSCLPLEFLAGPNTLYHMITAIPDHHWCCLEYLGYYDGYTSTEYLYCAYTVEGNTLILNPVETFNMDEVNNEITYSMSDEFITYEFSFRGRELTLSGYGGTMTYYAGIDYSDEGPRISTYAFLSGEHPLENMESLYFSYYDEEIGYFDVDLLDGNYVWDCSAKMESNGLLTMTIPWERGTKTYQFVYFYCDSDGMVLTDGVNTYYYNHDYLSYTGDDIFVNVTEEDRDILEDLTPDEVEEIIQRKDELLADLTAAFADAGITVTLNEATGELAMDASVLFGGDSAELTDEGKDFLDTFVEVYSTIINNEEYAGFVGTTLVEGHTAKLADSTYESGLELSQQRADVVKDYCASLDPALAETLEAVGMSCSVPIYAADGSIDLAASRRVSFRFYIDLSSFE